MVAATQQDIMAGRQQGLDALLNQYRAIQENAQSQAAQENWQNVMQGGGPMTRRVQGQMTGMAGDMATAAQRSQSDQLQRGYAASGGSIYDPAYQAQQGSLDTQRQLQTQGAARDIQMQAALANFQAQQQAAGSLATSAMQQQGLASPLASQLSQAHLGATWHTPGAEATQGGGNGGRGLMTMTQPGQYRPVQPGQTMMGGLNPSSQRMSAPMMSAPMETGFTGWDKAGKLTKNGGF
jgi:hypothetical protein